jgi:hypothetical protein
MTEVTVKACFLVFSVVVFFVVVVVVVVGSW